MVGNTDGSVTFRTYAQDMQGLKWVAHPYTEDTDN